MSFEAARVKEEPLGGWSEDVESPSWSDDAEAHVSVAAALADLYTDHKIKDELVIGPEVLQSARVVFTGRAQEPPIKTEWSDDDMMNLISLRIEGPMFAKETIWEEAEDVKDSWVNSAASCGVSEAAAAAGLYSGHQVKDELVVGPECLQPRAEPNSLLARVKEEVKEEDSEWEKYEGPYGLTGVSEAAARAGLYAGHIVKDELVLGPEGLQPADIVFTLRAPRSGTDCAVPLSPRPLSARASDQLAMTSPVERLRDEPSLRTEIKETHDKSIGARTEKEAYSCDTCGKRYTLKHNLVRHIKIHTGQKICNKQPYSCGICNKRFTSPKDLRRHIRIHTGEKPFSCEICNKPFSEKSSLKQHIRIHTGQKPYSCEICNKAFARNSTLKVHIKSHTGQKYSCEICNKQYRQKCSLNNHIRLHTDQRPRYSCETCNKQFMDKRCWKRHVRFHTQRRPCYICEICNKQFSAQCNLNMHLRVHTGQRPFSCDICNKQFTLKDMLRRHIAIHTQQKSYSCKICNKQFTLLRYLKIHIKRHSRRNTIQSRNSCDICQKPFTQKSHLKTHIRTHTGQKPITCEICNKQFTYRS